MFKGTFFFEAVLLSLLLKVFSSFETLIFFFW